MKKDSRRSQRVADLVRSEISNLLLTEVHDPEIRLVTIDAGVKPEVVGDVAAAIGTPGDPYHAAPLDAGDLSRGTPDGSRRRRDENRLTRPHTGDTQKAKVRGQARDAEDSDRR